MSAHPIEGMMDVTMEKIKSMVDANTIIGDPINLADGTLVLPISKVTYGFASGGSDFPSKTTKELFGGGSGAGVSIQPVGFLVAKEGNVRVMQLADTSNSVDRALSLVPELVDKLTALLQKNPEEKAGTQAEEPSEAQPEKE
ncbi:MAG: sporulation protein YtfJ [Subdoligranulum sp.]|nr:sporulation protein YtfJ [Subdoligranulum sp.]